MIKGFVSDQFEVGILKLDIIVDKAERFKSVLVHGEQEWMLFPLLLIAMSLSFCLPLRLP